MSALLVPVMSRYAKAWPRHGGNADRAEYLPIADALTTHYADDAHFCAYSVPSIEHRLDKTAIGRTEIDGGIPMVAFVVDVEPDGHAPRTPEWDAAEQPKILGAVADGAFAYWTRGGYRLVWVLAEPFHVITRADEERWSASYLAALDDVRDRYGIIADRTTKNWGREFRLPFVVRDGVAQELPTCGDPNAIGTWSLRIVSPATAPTTTVAPTQSSAPATPAQIAHAKDLLARHGQAIAGQRGNERTYQAVCKLVRGLNLDDAEAWPVLVDWNTRNDPPWDHEDLSRFLDNAYNYGSEEFGGRIAEASIASALARALGAGSSPSTPTVATDASAPTAIALPSTTSTLDELAGERTEWQQELDRTEAEIKSKLGTSTDTDHVPEPLFIPAVDLLRTKYTDPPWLVRELIKRGGTAIIAGEAKCGKSWALLEAMLAITSGTAAFGSFLTGKPLRGAYFFAEDHAPDVQAHVNALAKGRGMDPEHLVRNLYLQPRGHFIDVLNVRDLALLVASVRRLGGVDVLAIEPLRDIHSGKENESDDMSTVMRCLRLLGEILACSIITAHHTSNAGEVRGSSAIRGAYDSLLKLSHGTGGNGRDIIAAHVEVTTKGVRGAGKFDWRLEIEDDAQGHSTCAKWIVIRDEKDAGRAASDHKRDQAWSDITNVVEHVRKLQANGNEQTYTQLRSSVPGVPEKRAAKALGFALAEHYLKQIEVGDRRTGQKRIGERIRIGDVPLPKIPPLSLVASLLADGEPKARRAIRAIKTTEIKP